MAKKIYRAVFRVSEPDGVILITPKEEVPEGWEHVRVEALGEEEAKARARKIAHTIADLRHVQASGNAIPPTPEVMGRTVERLVNLTEAEIHGILVEAESGGYRFAGLSLVNVAAVIGGAAALHAILGSTAWEETTRADEEIRLGAYQAALAGVTFSEALRKLLKEHAELREETTPTAPPPGGPASA